MKEIISIIENAELTSLFFGESNLQWLLLTVLSSEDF